ncbi:VOC family protein [Aquabacter sp. CN5-332]|uniref:VOC family protein n=1 Tax=Aquabacter sp. CN5-332 TaxID=3156608 RepID=UPI0032B45F5A
MFDHFGMAARDLERSRIFYTAILAPLGIRYIETWDAERTGDYPSHGFGSDLPDFWIWGADYESGPVHFAFKAPNRAAVDAFYAAALAAGAKDNGAPGERPHFGKPYYAAFVLDPDGNNVEAVCYEPA